MYPTRKREQKGLVAPLRLVTPGPGPKRHERTSADTIGPDSVQERPQAHFSDLISEPLQWLQLGVVARHLTQGLAAQLRFTGCGSRPRPPPRVDQREEAMLNE